ncbi:uncharacterized protein N7473_002678 [Penicillium subrubescens]|uniref:DUF7514 domain-containing protein n=1 Tax=Penicillium subrubescens TaxID=1316194 RepID=A0A1Q5UKT4_9EURO|nr:uncharacterized protein N7473_002678 [Penicillium subrubescens]KAJ5905762.1 hypothetical protein N7473_002678 [Penicillium subrubescens]OKP13080.1 hypothetical protein PENSUB_1180 [Penicillium subrubescens]
MAYDGYHSSANPYQPGNMNSDPNDPHGYTPTPPYPSNNYEPDRLNMPQPQMPPPTSSPQSMDSDTPRPQNFGPGHGYLNDAVSSAVHQTNSSEYLSPDVLSQITATVIQQLKATGLGNLQGPGSSAPAPPRSQSQQPSWSAGPDLAPRPHSESPPNVSQRADSMPQVNPMSSSFESTQPYVAPQAPSSTGYASDTRDMRPTPKQSPDPLSSRRESMSSHGSQKMERPKPPSRDATVMEMTTLEKIWGKLFVDGKPTKRLGQFLRGIAMHLIEDYPPGNTIVIVPDKLQKFYADTDVSWDPYPWQDIFDDRTSSVSRLFREVKAQHHLVQLDDLKERPDIPGLTPKGFEVWATIMIQAHPEREYERLQKAVLNMPISNPDDKKERFPKEIPRRLFPDVADLKLREEVEEHIMKHCGVDLPRITEEERSQAARAKKPTPSHLEPSQPATPTTSGSTERSRSFERGRPPPSASSSAAVIDDEDEPAPSKPIERERKPYSAQPGGGKKYEEAGHTRSRTESFSSGRPLDVPSSVTSHRHSTSDKYSAADGLYSSRTGSGTGHPRRRYSRGSRSSSRGMSHDYRHSESDLLGRDAAPPRYGGVSTGDLYTDSPTSILPEDDVRRYREHHRGGSRASEDEYYRGLLGGQGGGPVHEHKRYH